MPKKLSDNPKAVEAAAIEHLRVHKLDAERIWRSLFQIEKDAEMKEAKQILQAAVKEADKEDAFEIEYRRCHLAYRALPTDVQSEIIREARGKHQIMTDEFGKEHDIYPLQKIKYSTKEYWQFIYDTAKEMGVIK